MGGSVDAGKQNNPLSPALLRGRSPPRATRSTTGSGDNIVAVPFLAFNNNVRERGTGRCGSCTPPISTRASACSAAWDSGHNDFALTTKGPRPVHLPVSGYFVQATYIVTGETREKITLIEPLHPFDLRAASSAWAPWSSRPATASSTVGQQVFTGGLADPNLWTNRADFVDAGFNWYLQQVRQVMFDWQHAMFAQPVYYRPGGFQKTSDLFWLRVQCYF